VTRRRDFDSMPERSKPLDEMTPDEVRQYARDLRRWMRDGDVRAGRRAPRTMRETELWLAGQEKRRGRQETRVERAQRRQQEKRDAD